MPNPNPAAVDPAAVNSGAASLASASHRRRWDPVVKLTHWSIALAVLANAVIFEDGSGPHIWVGYGLAAILALRLLWGLIGPAEARFTAFPPSPRRAFAHIGDIMAGRREPHRSHNPLGALMAYAIWATLLVIIATGMAMSGLPGSGRMAETAAAAPPAMVQTIAWDGDDEEHAGGSASGEPEEGIAEELHEAAANLLYGLILLHLAGVLFESRRGGRKLVLAMLPGRR